MKTTIVTWIQKHPLISFFVLTYLFTYGAGFGYVFLAPGQPLERWSLAWFVQAFGPSFAALIIGWIIGGKSEVLRLLSGFTRWKVGFFWYFAAAFLFLAPVVIALVYLALGNSTPGPLPGENFSSMAATIVFTLFSGPLAEELGWRGFALPRLQAKFSALVSCLILGVIWTFWHLPLFFTAGSSQMSIPFPIYLVLVMTVTIYLTWLYNNTRGSLIVTVLGHFSYNLTGFLTGVLRLMPAMVFYLTAGPLLAVLVVVIIFGYGPRHFSKKTSRQFTIYSENRS